MNIELKGNPDLIRSVEEGSRLLLSDINSSEEKVLTFLLEEISESDRASVTKEGNSCHICFGNPLSIFVFLITSSIIVEKIFLWKNALF